MTDESRSDSSRTTGGRSAAGDPELIIAARAGDGAAFLVLRHRHEKAALRLATLLCGSDEAAAVTERAFDRARRMLESGGGPDCAFRLQILSDVRTAAAAVGSVEEPAQNTVAAAASTPRAEADPIVRRSFLALPERWGSALWHTDVEQQTDVEVAALLGMRTATVTGLVARSRTGLVRGYLAGQVHQLDDPACAPVLDELDRSIDRLPNAGQDALVLAPSVQQHLDGCDGCRTAARTLTTLTRDLGAALAVVVLGEQGIPYLEAAERASKGTAVTAARTGGRPRSMRLVLVAVALVAVTASVPALRAGAGSDASTGAPAAAGFGPSLAPAVDAGTGPSEQTSTGGAVSTTVPADPTTGQATITTTGADGDPATTVTGDDPEPGTFTTLPTSSTTDQDAGPTSTGGGSPATTTSRYTPPLFRSRGPQTSDPAAPVTTGTTAPVPAVPGPTTSQSTAPDTTATTAGTTTSRPLVPSPVSPATTGSTAAPVTPADPTPPSTNTDPTPTTPDLTTPDPTTTELSESTPPSESTPVADVQVLGPTPATVAIVRLIDPTADIEFRVRNLTAGDIPEQSLTITLPEGVDLQAGNAATECERQDAISYRCTIRGMAESESEQQVSFTLTASEDAAIGTGAITVSVTGRGATGLLVVA